MSYIKYDSKCRICFGKGIAPLHNSETSKIMGRYACPCGKIINSKKDKTPKSR